MTRLASVAVPVPSVDLLTYRVPGDMEPPAVGARVLVPLGTRTLTGCVTAVENVDDEDPRSRDAGLRDILDVLDGDPYLPAAVLALAAWVAEYYAAGPGEAIAAAVPPMAWVESRRVLSLTDEGRRRLQALDIAGLTDVQRAAVEIVATAPRVPVSTVRARLGKRSPGGPRVAMAAVVRSLERAGWLGVSQVLEGERVAYKTERTVELTVQGRDVVERLSGDKSGLRLGPRQRELLLAIGAAPGGLAVDQLREMGLDIAGLRRPGLRELVAVRRRTVERDPFMGPWGRVAARANGAVAPDLTPDQTAALVRLSSALDSARFRVALLHGVTGSGKTEIYLRLAEQTLQAGRRALVLVPEISLTPAVAAAFRARFGDRVAIQHSGLSDGERHDQWQRIRRGDVGAVVGTRSAVFAPLADIGLIVVDEEHDGSYKQDDSPRYNGRDVAVVRGQQERALVVLGSATPSMESYAHAQRGRYDLVTLDRRILDRPLADVRTVNMREELAETGADPVISRALHAAIGIRLERREQVLILLNRRGYSTSVFCRQCGGTIDCPNCSVSLVVHGRGQAVCHYCNHARRVPRTCPACGGPFLEQVGFGTERVEMEVRASFPMARVARLDRDTVRRRGVMADMLAAFADGALDVLVGTQMIAKGHDFPRVTLVGVISADVGLGLADFRAAERTFQLLPQVVGRAGRGEVRGEAIIQTLYPDHYSIRYACRQDYAAFFEQELAYRRAMRYPPVVALVNGVVRAPSYAAAAEAAADLCRRIREYSTGTALAILGPAPAPLARLKGEHRAQFFVKGAPALRTAMRAAVVAAVRDRADLQRRVTIDVDPISIL
ncbi:MAG: primosomal protein N', partial [Acidobacteria bacterium]|nr:primosomal protein N' [Acidobacteriota bacterium]